MDTEPVSVNKPRPSTRAIIIWVGAAIIAILLFVVSYQLVSKLVSTWTITSLPGAAITEPTPTTAPENAGAEPAEAAPAPPGPTSGSVPLPEPWDGASRVNILLIGLDYNSWRGNSGPPLSDTMILFTIDPLTKTAGMLSIPRDLWVSIPGFEYGKINTAYQLGEAYKLPGGGPGLAMKTVESLLGVPVQYYAQIDFTAFVYFIDQMGGLKLDVPYEMYVDIYDDPKGKIRLEPGVQTLPGEYVLAYARSRSTEGGDFDRAARQQQVVMAIRQRILDFSLVPTFVQKAPEMYQQVSDGINTNLTLDQILRLGLLALDIPSDRIVNRIIGPEQVQLGKSPDGLDILKPLPDQIRILRDEVFTQTSTLPLGAQGKDPVQLMVEEGASIKILNGTTISGLATRTAEYLQSQGANVVQTGDADASDYSTTSLYDYTGNPYTLIYLRDLFGINRFQIHGRYDNASDVDVTIILGFDWANNNPMP